MTEPARKFSPTEFLAELKRQVAEKPLPDDGPPAADFADLDFSDLADLATGPDAPGPPAGRPSRRRTAAAGDDEVRDDGPATAADPGNLRDNPHLFALFDRVNRLLGTGHAADDEPFRPRAVESLYQTGLTSEEIERLMLKFLLSRGAATGRQIAAQICLPFQITDPLLRQLKQEQIVAFSGSAEMGDYEFTITERGRERARAYSQECTYFGACPVALRDYLRAMEAQSIGRQEATEEDLREAFSDLIVPQTLLDRLGPAVNSGRGMFLFGEPGNGKTSIAERITRCFGSTIWIPRALGIDGDIIRVYDPGVHEIVERDASEGLFDLSGVDQRWVQIVRPTVIAGGELTMSELEVTQNKQTKICEAPLQLKSNCGTLVIDDFGRQTMPTDVLLNRWIVPLEKRFDYLNLPSGKKVQVPFDQLIIFSTNLEPRDLVDDAFLRRIPYKIEIPDPDRAQFVALFERMCPLMGFQYDAAAVEYLIEKHYAGAGRPFRACQPRDLLLQVKNYCTYKRKPRQLNPEAFDFAVENYFSVM
ncbi:MAG: AAA family ATPase [Planctomycetales bacterium]